VRRGSAIALLALVAGTALTGCANDNTATTRVPVCSAIEDGQPANGVLLMAQSVQTAEWIPCVRAALPLGWSFRELNARSGYAAFSFNSDRDGDRAILVRLSPRCDTSGATRIPSDREGMQRFERVAETTPDYHGARYYIFGGGCITFQFRLLGEERGEALALAADAVGVVARSDLQKLVDKNSGGRLALDPPASEESGS
jgi:hypothetical protein